VKVRPVLSPVGPSVLVGLFDRWEAPHIAGECRQKMGCLVFPKMVCNTVSTYRTGTRTYGTGTITRVLQLLTDDKLTLFKVQSSKFKSSQDE
jgi:hypothetical protein